MELKDFIRNALLGIVDGIHEASEALSKKRYTELPFNQFSINDIGKTEYRYINFDVAIMTAKETSGKAEGGGKIFVADVNVGGQIKYGTEHISRVQFKVWCGN